MITVTHHPKSKPDKSHNICESNMALELLGKVGLAFLAGPTSNVYYSYRIFTYKFNNVWKVGTCYLLTADELRLKDVLMPVDAQ